MAMSGVFYLSRTTDVVAWCCRKEWFVVSPEPAEESKKYGDRRNEHSDVVQDPEWRGG